jgi:two-component system sensor histidine kinase MprB
VERLSEAVDHVTVTGDLTRHVPDDRTDELGRLGANFNRMLTVLRHSLKSQRQLVADASHELRTPLASLRTNVEVLERAPRLPVVERKKLVRDLVVQCERLTRLVHDLIDLAREDQPLDTVGPVQLDALVRQAVERAASHWPRVTFAENLGRAVVRGDADRIERAVGNLLDNAGKWSPPGGVVEVGGAAGEVTGHRPTRRSARVRPFLASRGGAGAARLGPRPLDREAGCRRARGDRERGVAGRWGHVDALSVRRFLGCCKAPVRGV